ncbi:hypothetical protein Tco_1236529 [Tanacetum coccineum]
MALPPRQQRHMFLRYEGLEYLDTDIVDFEGRLARIHKREVHRVPVLNFGGLPHLMAEGLSGRMLMEHHDEAAPSYTLIRDSILRLCHRLIACSIAERSQAPKKVTVMDLFYLRGMDVGSVNIPYLLARLAEHFGLLTAEILGGLTACVAMGPERQPVAMAGALVVTKDALIIDEGIQPDFLRELTHSIPETDQTEDWRGQYLRRKAGLAAAMPMIPHIFIFCLYLTKPGRPREGNIDEYWWRIYESGNLEVLES